VNLWGIIHGIRAFVPRMLEQDEPGHIVNTASIAGLTSGSGLPIYGASKHAVVRGSEALHGPLAEAKSKLKVSVLCPGGVNTRIASAGRNRPADLREDGDAPSVQQASQRDAQWANPAGMAPETVADKVFAAIQDEKFYILTHDEYDGVIRARMEAILSRSNPGPAAF
jgi:short-subunit dehydrogenase